MEDNLEKLKERLWKQFNRACDVAERLDKGTPESRAQNRNAAGTLGAAIVDVERELRERSEKTRFNVIK